MITVLLPVYNAEKYISRCIKSVLAQTFRDFELVIVDSSSHDRTVQIVSSFEDKRLKLFEIERCSLSESLNYGLQKSGFELIARMDADDLMVSERLEVQLCYLRDHPEVDVLSCSYFYFSENKLLFPVPLPETDYEIKRGLPLHNYICHSGCIYKRSLILECGGYRNTTVEDYELWLRIKEKAVFANVPQFLMFASFSSESLSRKNLGFKAEVYKVQQTYWDSFERFFHETAADEKEELAGWREYFYGDKSRVRGFWHFMKLPLSGKIAYLTSFLPESIFILALNQRLRLRLMYIFRYFGTKFSAARNQFNKLMNAV